MATEPFHARPDPPLTDFIYFSSPRWNVGATYMLKYKTVKNIRPWRNVWNSIELALFESLIQQVPSNL